MKSKTKLYMKTYVNVERYLTVHGISKLNLIASLNITRGRIDATFRH